MKITKQQAREFLENIKPSEKVLMVYHIDLDGFASGILVYDFLKERGCELEVLPFNYGDEFNIDLSSFDRIVVVDIASRVIGEFINNFGDKAIVIDHHPQILQNSKFFEYNDSDIGYVPSSRTCYEIVDGKMWLALLGTLADKGYLDKINKNFIEECLFELSISFEEAQEIAMQLSEVLVYFNNGRGESFEVLKNLNSLSDVQGLEKYYKSVEEEMNFLVEDFEKKREVYGDVYFYYFEPRFKIKKPLASVLSAKYVNKIIFLASPSEESISLSVRNGVGGLNAIDIANIVLKDLPLATWGGHQKATGGAIRKEDLPKLRENLKNYSETFE